MTDHHHNLIKEFPEYAEKINKLNNDKVCGYKHEIIDC